MCEALSPPLLAVCAVHTVCVLLHTALVGAHCVCVCVRARARVCSAVFLKRRSVLPETWLMPPSRGRSSRPVCTFYSRPG